MGYKGRDVEVVWLNDDMNQDQCLLVACDSSGAIGAKELDVVGVPPQIVGRFGARVALLEVLAAGGRPRALTVTISSEPVPTGEGILEGIREELSALGLDSLPMAISTEKNMPTRQTGLGVGVTATASRNTLRIGRSQAGDRVYCLGIPKVGAEVTSPEDTEIIQGRDILNLLQIPGVHDLVPVGSRGLQREAEGLAEAASCRMEMFPSKLDLAKSAGPSTCLVVTTPLELSSEGSVRTGLPLTCIGKLV